MSTPEVGFTYTIKAVYDKLEETQAQVQKLENKISAIWIGHGLIIGAVAFIIADFFRK